MSSVTKRLNVLVYSGTGSTLESVRHCLYTLRRLLSPNYAVLTVTGDVLKKEPWQPTCALLVFPGGADLGYCATLNGHGNRLIRQYVNTGGSYLGLCAGGYYGSARCEFEVGGGSMEVTGDRELEFFPGIARGSAFKGFVYNSEEGTRAADLKVDQTAFAGIEGVAAIPDSLKAYANGGSVFVDADRFADRGVEILARYQGKLDVEAGQGDAAVVFRRIGDGNVLLTGPHPEFAAANLSKTATGANSTIIDALTADDEKRKIFFKACLKKLGMSINEQDEDPPSLSSIHLSTTTGTLEAVLNAWTASAVDKDGEAYLEGGNDTFHIEQGSTTWLSDKLGKTTLTDNDQIGTLDSDTDLSDPTTAIKGIKTHLDGPPDAKETPYFNHSAYFSSLLAHNSYSSAESSSGINLGQPLLYGEVVTSTSTLLEKNPKFTSPLPTGTTFTATTQLSGRGRGSNVWVSPAGSLMFSFILRHPLKLSATAPIVFLQYLAALAVAEGVQTYDVEGVDPMKLISADKTNKQSAYRTVPIALKWPNDIYALDPAKGPSADPKDRSNYTKIGGILVNTSYAGGDYTAIVGIGLNTANAAPTTSLNALMEVLNTARPASKQLQPFTLERLLARILTCFEALYVHFCARGFSGQLERLYERHWLHEGQIVTLEVEGGVKARIRGITRDWGLLRAEEVKDVGGIWVGTGKEFALQSDSNSFDFFKGLVKRKL